MPSATNERQIRERNKRIAEDRRTYETVVRALMSTVDGRRWVWLRLEEAQLFISDADLDPYRMAYAKGRKEFALQLLQAVNRFCPNDYITMTAENSGRALQPSSPEEEDAHVH